MTTAPARLTGDPVAPPRGVALRREVRSHRDLAFALFVDRSTAGGLRHVREVPVRAPAATPVAPESLAEAPLFALRDDRGVVAVFAEDGAVVHVALSTGSGSASVAARSADRADALAEAVAARFGGGERPEDEIAVRFWTAGSGYPRSVQREIVAPGWHEVSSGYEGSTRDAIDELMAAEVPAAGRLILWHGPPGTGKTSALRALARAWSTWCATHFVTDPEHFLGQGTGYLLDVLTAGSSRAREAEVEWKLVVLEDAGELLAVDAHERMGQALSRLLNVTDGLLGQGMNVLTLVTTNEPLGALHPAVTRPGRCWRAIEFAPLEPAEANAWLAGHGSPVRVARRTTLAELYDALRGRRPEPEREFGFGLGSRGG